MKTTLNLDDELLRRAKRRAAERGTTLTRVIEEALQQSLVDGPEPESFRLRMPTVKGRRRPRVDPADRDALYGLMEQAQ